MKNNYVTLVYLSQDEENANYLAEILEDTKHVEVHKFEKGEDYDQDIIKDINDSCGLIILHISDEFDYRIHHPRPLSPANSPTLQAERLSGWHNLLIRPWLRAKVHLPILKLIQVSNT